MPIRGKRPIMPKPGGKAKRMFTGTAAKGEHQELMNYALGGGGECRSKPTGSGGKDLRHQPPKRSS